MDHGIAVDGADGAAAGQQPEHDEAERAGERVDPPAPVAVIGHGAEVAEQTGKGDVDGETGQGANSGHGGHRLVPTGWASAQFFSCHQLDKTTEIGNRNRALIAFMLDTGVRLAEVAGLTLERVDIKEGTALIEGKGSKQRMVYFSEGTQEAIRRWLTIRGDEVGSLFWLQPGGVRMVLERIKRETGLSVLFAHQLRHTCFTMLVRDGVDLHTVKRLAGHSSVTVTESYLNMADEDLRDKQRLASPFDRINSRLTPQPSHGRRGLKSA